MLRHAQFDDSMPHRPDFVTRRLLAGRAGMRLDQPGARQQHNPRRPAKSGSDEVQDHRQPVDVHHSYRSDFTGSAFAARKHWKATVMIATSTVPSVTAMYTHAGMLMRDENCAK